jgi:hypothetical protein
VELHCASVEKQGELWMIDLYWHVAGRPDRDYTVFVHGLDAGGNAVQQNDYPPIGGNYPTSAWQRGQNLVDRHTLPTDPPIDAVAVGLYTSDAGRLPVTQDGDPVPNDSIVLPLQEASCLP